MNNKDVAFSGIYAVLDRAMRGESAEVLDAVLRAGIRILQYRGKDGVDREALTRMCARAHACGAIVIVNDDLEAALEADGLHVGQEDLAFVDATSLRERLGSRVFGISCATPEEAREAERLGADYVGVGPFKNTASKADAGPEIGVPGIQAVVESTRLPVVAIGGIGVNDVEDVVRSGASMAAVISAIAGASDPEASARALVERWSMHGRERA